MGGASDRAAVVADDAAGTVDAVAADAGARASQVCRSPRRRS